MKTVQAIGLCWGIAMVSCDAAPPKPQCKTDLDCRLAANAARMGTVCADAERGRRHVQDREFDLARGLRTGALSAAEVRRAGATLAATREYTAKYETECAQVREEAQQLTDEAVRVVRAREKAELKPTTAKAASPRKPKASAVAAGPEKPGAKVRGWLKQANQNPTEDVSGD